MSDQVWKYSLSIEGLNAIEMPQGAEPLSVQMQDGRPTLWARVDPPADAEERIFAFVGTGHPMPDQLQHSYIGTIQTPPFVWHLFELQDAKVTA